MTTCRVRTVLCSLLLLIHLAAGACAGLVDEHSWSATSPNGRFILVMTLGEDFVEELKKQGYEDNDRGIDLRREYPECGVYANDGSTVPLWTLPYYEQVYGAYITNDGAHVLLAQEETKHTISNIPVGGYLYFHHRDGTHQSFPEHAVGWGWGIKRLLIDQILGIKVDGWTAWISTEFEPVGNIYTIDTDKGESYVFDIATGQIIRSSSLWNKILTVFFAAVPLTVYFMLRRKPQRLQPSRSLRRFSLRALLVLMSASCVWLWLATVSWPLAVAVILAPLIGGGIARVWSRRPRAWITGTLLAIYGFVWGLFLWAILIEPLMWEARRESLYACFLPAFAAMGLFGGAILGGVLERRVAAFTKQTGDQLP